MQWRDRSQETYPKGEKTTMIRQTIHPFVMASGLLALLCLFFGLALTASAWESAPGATNSGSGPGVAHAVEAPVSLGIDASLAVTSTLYLPMIGRDLSGATTSSATLAQPPARGQLGLLGGLLAAGFVVGLALVFWGEPEAIQAAQDAEEIRPNDPTQPRA